VRVKKQFVAVFLILLLPLSIWGPAKAQTEVKYFPESEHYVRGAFLQYYNAAKDPVQVYGYPITEQITARDGKTVQYFNKARFEITSDNQVVLTPLGRLMYTPQNPLPINSVKGCQEYETGYNVCLDFLKLYKANGENRQFGDPISSFEYAPNGLLVQYFEGARFEWHTNLNPDDWVVIADLGRLYFDQQKEDRAFLQPAPPPDATIRSAVSLEARAFVLKAVTFKNGTQTIYVFVNNERTSQAVSDANITALVHLSDGTDLPLAFNSNSAGIGQVSFNFSDQKPGELVTIDITIGYQDSSTTTATSFRVWY